MTAPTHTHAKRRVLVLVRPADFPPFTARLLFWPVPPEHRRTPTDRTRRYRGNRARVLLPGGGTRSVSCDTVVLLPTGCIHCGQQQLAAGSTCPDRNAPGERHQLATDTLTRTP